MLYLLSMGANPDIECMSGRSSYDHAKRVDSHNQMDAEKRERKTKKEEVEKEVIEKKSNKTQIYLSPMEWKRKHDGWKDARQLEVLNPYKGVKMLDLLRRYDYRCYFFYYYFTCTVILLLQFSSSGTYKYFCCCIL